MKDKSLTNKKNPPIYKNLTKEEEYDDFFNCIIILQTIINKFGNLNEIINFIKDIYPNQNKVKQTNKQKPLSEKTLEMESHKTHPPSTSPT